MMMGHSTVHGSVGGPRADSGLQLAFGEKWKHSHRVELGEGGRSQQQAELKMFMHSRPDPAGVAEGPDKSHRYFGIMLVQMAILASLLLLDTFKPPQT